MVTRTVDKKKCISFKTKLITYCSTVIQRRTGTTLFLSRTVLLKQSRFVILKKITRVANNT